MADRRKLQGEIDRCLKKVTEGVETFEDIWGKLRGPQVHTAANSNQKEKYEADLKKEIKKLQRLRDQIKTWVASNDIKDKSVLLSNRKLIETQMERFKVVERETKTKAYSKEGLGAAAKMDPREKEKEELLSWISNCIDNLKIQSDQMDAQVEGLAARGKRRQNDRDASKTEDLKKSLERHKFHINKLETLMRLVDNDALEVEQIKKIRDDVEYFVEFNQDAGFEENEFLYDDLDLEEISAQMSAGVLATSPVDNDMESIVSANVSSTTPSSNNSSTPSPSPNVGPANHSKEKSEDDRKRHKSQSEDNKSSSSSSSSSKNGTSSSSSVISNKVPSTPTKHNHVNSGASGSSTIEVMNHTAPPPPSSVHGYAQAASSHHNSSDKVGVVNSVDHSGASSQSLTPAASLSTPLPSSVAQPTVLPTAPSPAPSPASIQQHIVFTSAAGSQHTSSTSSPSSSSSSTSSSVTPSTTACPVDLPLMNGPASVHEGEVQSPSMTSLKTIAQQAVDRQGLSSQVVSHVSSDLIPPTTIFNNTSALSAQTTSAPSDPSSAVVAAAVAAAVSGSQPPQLSQPSAQQPAQSTTIHLNPVLGVAPLGPQPLNKEQFFQLAMLEAASQHLPHPADSERIRAYFPHNPCPTPSYYPQVPPHHSDTVEFFQRLHTETLFFIFYYMEGTKAQYLAAKALKQKSWRFHTKYMMWFQRHEEPKTITEDCEQGTYIYFDYEKWGQRKKEGFTFEYKYLEDRDLN